MNELQDRRTAGRQNVKILQFILPFCHPAMSYEGTSRRSAFLTSSNWS